MALILSSGGVRASWVALTLSSDGVRASGGGSYFKLGRCTSILRVMTNWFFGIFCSCAAHARTPPQRALPMLVHRPNRALPMLGHRPNRTLPMLVHRPCPYTAPSSSLFLCSYTALTIIKPHYRSEGPRQGSSGVFFGAF